MTKDKSLTYEILKHKGDNKLIQATIQGNINLFWINSIVKVEYDVREIASHSPIVKISFAGGGHIWVRSYRNTTVEPKVTADQAKSFFEFIRNLL